MRILFWGNAGNTTYQLAKILKKRGHVIELFMMSSDINRSDPASIDKKNPSWVRYYNNDGVLKKISINNKIKKYINSSFDIVIVCGSSITNSFWFSLPVLVYPTGGELNSDPFFKRGHFFRLRYTILAIVHNYSIRKASKILAGGAFTPDIKAYARLKHKGITNIYMPVDGVEHRSRVDAQLTHSLNLQYQEFDLVIMWFTRINMDKSAPSYKAPELFLSELFDFLKNTQKKIRIIYGAHGTHVKQFEDLISASGMEGCFESVPHMEYWRLQSYYLIDNGVVVETMMPAGGNMSNVARDCMALGTPMITNYSDDILAVYPKSWPILKVEKKGDLTKRLHEVSLWGYKDKDDYKKSVREWFSSYMDSENITDLIEKIFTYEVLLNKHRSIWPYPLSLIGKNKGC